MKQLGLFSSRALFENRSVRDVTFQGKMTRPIHRWYRLTPSFSPKLALDIADHFSLARTDLVLDPFSGVGTVPLCMKYRGVPAWSVEINPYLYFVGEVKTRDYHDVDSIRDCLLKFVALLREEAGRLPEEGKAEQYLSENEQFVPPIHRPLRWWSAGNLMQLTCLRRLLLTQTDLPVDQMDLLKLSVLSILVPVSNARHNHVSLTFAAEALPTVSVADVLEEKCREMISDLRRVSELPRATVRAFLGNSKEVSTVLPSNRQVSAVITSPPYPNRFSYARETRPHLFFLNFVTRARQVGELETDAIGGTWGKATSVLSKGIRPANDFLSEILSPYVGSIDQDCNLMGSYVTKYFNNIYSHAAELAKVCHKRCRLAYVIGNSKFFGKPLPSDELLAAVFEHHGFDREGISRMRRRQSKSGLYEAVVFLRRRKTE
ncbi:MAG TPA: hypothetical protein VM031_02705 [Phycisphaerae bacterium]|nr:hypothetical protein [Phycisphaerae bacterium]